MYNLLINKKKRTYALKSWGLITACVVIIVSLDCICFYTKWGKWDNILSRHWGKPLFGGDQKIMFENIFECLIGSYIIPQSIYTYI